MEGIEIENIKKGFLSTEKIQKKFRGVSKLFNLIGYSLLPPFTLFYLLLPSSDYIISINIHPQSNILTIFCYKHFFDAIKKSC